MKQNVFFLFVHSILPIAFFLDLEQSFTLKTAVSGELSSFAPGASIPKLIYYIIIVIYSMACWTSHFTYLFLFNFLNYLQGFFLMDLRIPEISIILLLTDILRGV